MSMSAAKPEKRIDVVGHYLLLSLAGLPVILLVKLDIGR